MPGVSEATSQHLYLNQVLPLVLSKLGKLVFHASAVEVPGGAVAFAAESGRGKSTLAASFAVNGFRFLTDDGLVLEPAADGYQVQPSHPSIRLWEDSEEALIAPGVETAPAVSFTSKSRFLAGEAIPFCDQPRPLRRMYFLGDGSAETIQIHRLSPAEALVEWVKHSFLLDVEEQAPAGLAFRSGGRSGQPAHTLPPRLPEALRGPAARSRGDPGPRATAGRGSMKLSDKVSIPPQVMARTVGEETVILDLGDRDLLRPRPGRRADLGADGRRQDPRRDLRPDAGGIRGLARGAGARHAETRAGSCRPRPHQRGISTRS